MASSEHQLRSLAQEATCSFCLGYFREPVSVQCGHTFCTPCITSYWQGLKGGQQGTYPCPQCRQTAPTDTLRPNRQLASIVQILAHGPPGEPPTVEPQMVEEHPCTEHDQVSKLFCGEDRTPICVNCRKSTCLRPQSPYREILKLLQGRMQSIIDDEKRKLATIAELQSQIESKLTELEEIFNIERDRNMNAFSQVQQFLEKERCSHLSMLDEKKKRTLQETKEKVAAIENQKAAARVQITKMEATYQQQEVQLKKLGKLTRADKEQGNCLQSTLQVGSELQKLQRADEGQGNALQRSLQERMSVISSFLKEKWQRPDEEIKEESEEEEEEEAVIEEEEEEEQVIEEEDDAAEEDDEAAEEEDEVAEEDDDEAAEEDDDEAAEEDDEAAEEEEETAEEEEADDEEAVEEEEEAEEEAGEEEKEQEDVEAEKDLQRLIIESLEWRWARSYADAVTLDPDTAHLQLILYEDGRSVRRGDRAQDLPDTPERYNFAYSVLGRERLSAGRHYWEVEVGDNTAWDLGVCDESASRKGAITASPESGYWAVCLRDGEYKALTAPVTTLTLDVPPRVVGLFMDYEAGRITVYNVTDRSLLYTFSETFPGILRPFFCPGASSGRMDVGGLRVLPVIEQD